MALTKTLATLLERAERKGEAVKRVREASVMGSGYGWGSWEERAERLKNSPMINQWEVKVTRTMGQVALQVTQYEVFHYDTLIARISDRNERWELHYFYGESTSDADALSGLCAHFGIAKRFTFRPVNGGFQEI